MPKIFQPLIGFATKHKVWCALIGLVVVGAGYVGYATWTGGSGEVRYVTAIVEKGTVITSVTGSGQISVSNQVDVKSKASGDVLSVAVTNGQEVKAGDVLVQLNTRDAQKAVRDAQSNWATTKVSLDKLTRQTDPYTILQSENALSASQASLEKLKLTQQTNSQNVLDTKQKAEDNLVKAYEDTFNAVADVFLDLPDVMTDLNVILYSSDIGKSESSLSGGQSNISDLINSVSLEHSSDLRTAQNIAESDYASARALYDATLDQYRNTNRYSDHAAVESLLAEAVKTIKAVAQATKSESNYLGSWADFRTQSGWTVFSIVKTYQSSLATDISTTNGHFSSLLAIQQTLEGSRDAIVSADRDLTEMEQNNPLDLAAAEATVKEREAALANLKAGPDVLDVQSQKLALQQRANSLADAREKLADYTVRAPFDGVIAKIDVKKTDAVSAGTVIATLISMQKLAEISLNEVDVAKVAVGQKATLTFDAVDGLGISGEVAEIDTLGTVAQGVVSYSVKILFDTQDDRIKSGMSVSTAIITEAKSDVLNVPNSAVKIQGNTHVVEVFDPPLASNPGSQGTASQTPPRPQTVEVGLSNDTVTEITSGLKEGDQVVVRTIAPTTQPTAQQAPSLFGGAAGGAGAGGAVRIPR